MTIRDESPQELAGRLEADGHCLNVRAYYEDTDFTGVVYHASYIRFMERGRSDFLRMLGVHHRALKEGAFGEPLAFAVRRLAVDFLLPAKVDDVLQVWTRCRETSGARIELDQEIRRGTDVLLHGRVSVIVVNDNGKPRRVPAEIAKTLAGRR